MQRYMHSPCQIKLFMDNNDLGVCVRMLRAFYELRFRLVEKIFLLIIARISTLQMPQFPAQYAIDAPELYFEKENIWKKSLLNYLLTIETYSLTNKCGARKFLGSITIRLFGDGGRRA